MSQTFLTNLKSTPDEWANKSDKRILRGRIDIPTTDTIPLELLEIAHKIANISGTWNPVEIFTPDHVSIVREKTRFFDSFAKSIEYNPTFTYSHATSLDLTSQRKQLIAQLNKLHKFEPSVSDVPKNHTKRIIQKLIFFKNDPHENKSVRTARLIKAALVFKIKDDLATCSLVDGLKIGDEAKIAAALNQKYPGVDQSLYELAAEEYLRLSKNETDLDKLTPSGKGILTIDQVVFLKEKIITPNEIAEAFKWALSRYGILRMTSIGTGFYVQVSQEATCIDVRDKSENGPSIVIPSDPSEPINAYKLLQLIAHEIDGHARQSVNGEELFLIGGGRLKIDDEKLYEGLGLRYEFNIVKKLYGIESPKPSPFYTLSCKLAQDGASFYQIFVDQIEKRTCVLLKIPEDKTHINYSKLQIKDQNLIKEQAWMGTYRIMRGHIDMSNKYKFANAKDLGYLRGYQMDQQLSQNGLGNMNEEGVIASGALSLLSEFRCSEEMLPLPFKDVATQYFEEVLLPQIPK